MYKIGAFRAEGKGYSAWVEGKQAELDDVFYCGSINGTCPGSLAWAPNRPSPVYGDQCVIMINFKTNGLTNVGCSALFNVLCAVDRLVVEDTVTARRRYLEELLSL